MGCGKQESERFVKEEPLAKTPGVEGILCRKEGQQSREEAGGPGGSQSASWAGGTREGAQAPLYLQKRHPTFNLSS